MRQGWFLNNIQLCKKDTTSKPSSSSIGLLDLTDNQDDKPLYPTDISTVSSLNLFINISSP